MSQLELRNLATDENVIVPTEGFIFGREGGDADIQLADRTIAKRHMRVCLKQGQWVLETLAVAAGAKLPRPQPLEEGSTFLVGETEFEVTAAIVDDEDMGDEAPPPPAKARPSSAAVRTTPARDAQPRPKPAAAAPAAKPVAKPAPRAAPPTDEGDDGGEGEPMKMPSGAAGIKGLFVGVPKGIAYYLVNVPKMLVNPLGTVRKAIEEQPSPALYNTDLIGFALPSMLATNVLSVLAAMIASIIAGAFMLPIVPLITAGIVAAVSAVITGFVFHPVLNWIITKLKGQSTPKSRSNYFLQLQTLAIVLAIPQALGTILSSIRFLNLIGGLLLAVASLVGVFVNYKWLEHFGVVKWLLTVVKVVGALVVLGAVGSFGNNLMISIRGGGSSASASADDAKEAMEKALAAQQDAAKLSNDAQAMGLDAQAKAAAAIAAANKNVQDAQKVAADATKVAAAKVEEVKEPAKEEKKPKLSEPIEEPKKPEPVKEEPKKVEPVKAAEPVKEAPVEAPAHAAVPRRANEPEVAYAAQESAFAAFARRRASVEATLAADPTIFNKKEKLKGMYGAYLSDVSRIEKSFAKDLSKHSDQAQMYEYLKQAQLFSELDDRLKDIAKVLGLP